MINRIERPLANDHPDGSFSVHLFLHRPKTQNLRIIGQYTHNLLGLKTLSFALLLSSTKIWIKGPQIGSDMPSALGLVHHHLDIVHHLYDNYLLIVHLLTPVSLHPTPRAGKLQSAGHLRIFSNKFLTFTCYLMIELQSSCFDIHFLH